ncbi:MAG: glycosyl hydrolase family 2, partial [Fermentimonas sp.]|nr:glycosyl hydrolase family 2 [Fermentimonas sp.]
QGATVIFVDQYPSDVPGLYDLDKRREQFNLVMSDFPEVSTFDDVTRIELGKGAVITGSNYSDILELWKYDKELFVSELGGQMVRRKHENGHIYFMSMLSNNPVDGWVGLGVYAKSAMIFDPMTGEKGKAMLRNNNGKNEVYLQLKPGESVILKTFFNDIKAEGWKYYSPSAETIDLSRDWELSFINSDPMIEESFSIDTLSSWTDIEHDSLKVNRGTGKYRKAFQFYKNPDSEYLLSLGDVRESASVKINGIDAGTLYAVPFETKIGNLLQDGENIIEIEVTNLPANRIADYDRKGVEWRIFNEINFVSITYEPTKFDIWNIMPSGLLGPVNIKELKTFNP